MTLLARLNPRERIIVLAGSAFLIVLAGWLYVWQPLSAQRAVQAERIAQYLTVLELSRTADTLALPAPSAPVSTAPLAPRITQSAEAAGIPLARLDPEGARLRVTVAAADFDDLARWIASLEAGEGVRTVSLEMSRLAQPGQVSMRLSLEDSQ